MDYDFILPFYFNDEWEEFKMTGQEHSYQILIYACLYCSYSCQKESFPQQLHTRLENAESSSSAFPR
jgi:hypothetical protein